MKIFLLIIILSSFTLAQNYRIYPSNVTQTEVFSAIHPFNPDLIFVSAHTINFTPSFFVSEGIYVTTNNGNNWRGNDTCTGEIVQFHGGDPGIAIDKNGTFVLTRLGRDPFPGLYSHFSTDNGLTWSSQKTLSTDDLERATLTSDAVSGSAFYGRTYAVWVKFVSPFPVVFTYTDDGGQNWSLPSKQINNPARRSAGGEVAVGPNGEVYVCWASVTNVSPFEEVSVGFASSSSGGANWNVTEEAYPIKGIQGQLSQKQNIRVNGYPRIAVDLTGGERNGWIYLVTTQKNLAPAGSDPDIILNRSSNGGHTWSGGIRVNRDALNNAKIQYFPAIHVDKTGAINIIYFDDRNTTSDSTGVFLSRSTDGGDSWSEYEISDHNYKPSPLAGTAQGYQGDNIALNSTNNILWPFWMDNSSGIYQVWTAPVDLTILSADNLNEASPPSGFELGQNYPNPFNPVTKIKYAVPSSLSSKERAGVRSFVTVKVYDVLGNEVATLVSEVKEPGEYEVEFNGSSLASGVYYYRLTAGSFSDTKKLVLLK